MLGAIVSGISNVVGGLFGKSSADKAAAANAQAHAENIQLQKDFAQQGIRWKVADAKAAGIHPLYALGANTVSFAPQALGAVPDNSMANALSASGQDISRAINSTRTGPERADAYTKTVQELSLQKFGLENQLLAAQIAKLQQTPNPPYPALDPQIPLDKFGARPRLSLGRGEIITAPGVSNTDDFTKRYGEGADYLFGPQVMYQDWKLNNAATSKRMIGQAIQEHKKYHSWDPSYLFERR